MIKNTDAYRRRSDDERDEALQRMTAEESIAVGEALLTSEIMASARFPHEDRPRSLAISLGIQSRVSAP